MEKNRWGPPPKKTSKPLPACLSFLRARSQNKVFREQFQAKKPGLRVIPIELQNLHCDTPLRSLKRHMETAPLRSLREIFRAVIWCAIGIIHSPLKY